MTDRPLRGKTLGLKSQPGQTSALNDLSIGGLSAEADEFQLQIAEEQAQAFVHREPAIDADADQPEVDFEADPLFGTCWEGKLW